MTQGATNPRPAVSSSSRRATLSKETPEQRHARRVAWGKESGAKVAAAYKALQEAS